MKKFAFFAAPLGVLAAAACAVPWYLGMQAEHELRAQVSNLSRSAQFPFSVALMRYDRGWLSSSAVTRFTLKADADYGVEVRHEISQLPDPRDGWVHVHSVPQWSGPVKSAVDYYFGGQPVLSVDTVVGFDGSRTATLHSPAFSKPMSGSEAAKLNWGGLNGTLTANQDGRMTFNLIAPSFALEAGEMHSGMKGLTLNADWNVRGTAAEWQGETKLAVSQFQFAGPQQQVLLQNFSGAFYQRAKGENVLIGYVLRLGFGSSQRPGEATDSFTNAVIDLELDQVNKKALAKYLDGLSGTGQTQMSAEAQNRMSAQLAVNLASELLRSSPVIRLKQLGVETPSGGVSAQATIAFDGSGLNAVQVSPELLSRLKAKGNLEISGTLLRTQLQRKVRPQVEVALTQQGGAKSEESIQALAAKLTEDQLKSLTDSGILHANGANFTIDAELTAGQVLVNGQPANQLFGGMFPSPSPAAQPATPLQSATAPQPAVYVSPPRAAAAAIANAPR